MAARKSGTKSTYKTDKANTTKHDDDRFPIVGIGASAGGLAAFETFFSGMPADTDPGMAFVLVQHLAPDHKSILTDIIRRYTRMQVFEVEDGMKVEPNCTYIIPPGMDMALSGGTLQLIEPTEARGQRLPIDFFFHSIALELHERAIAVILSGTGSDGTQGARFIKQEGGVVIAQTRESATFDGMPASIISSGLADYELQPEEIPARLIAFVSHADETGELPLVKDKNALKRVFELLRAQTGHDFSLYKPSTVYRRVERRMAFLQIENLERYIVYLRKQKEELDALFRDLLIGVTSFFRDPEAFAALEKEVIPKIFADKEIGEPVRVWVPGCSTGEEAYSIAILIREYMDAARRNDTVQIFASDIDARAIVTARAGQYPEAIAADITPQRLKRFFVRSADGTMYNIHKSIRDMLIFSEHDVIKDPPFSKLDLISCRNLLIYMSTELQQKLLPLFHYALYPEGFLFLGSSETLGELANLFIVLDQKSKLFQCDKKGGSIGRIPPGRAVQTGQQHPGFSTAEIRREQRTPLPLRELTEQTLLQQIAPAAALVNEQGDILYLHGRMGMYLELPEGETGVNNILKMARKGLKHDLAIALAKVKMHQHPVCHPGLHIKTNEHYSSADLTISAVTSTLYTDVSQPLYLVVLEKIIPSLDEKSSKKTASLRVGAEEDADHRTLEELKRELRIQEKFLHDANARLEISNEELKSYNEEMQSMNEELQSTNEELETSREELQSVNEELSTVNAELQTKVADLSQSNNDMNNLLAGTGIGTVFVDHDLCVLRFTPAVVRIINLIAGDVGRPVGHIVSNLVGYDRLVADTQEVLDTLVPKEVEVQTVDGQWFLMRIQPYRTLENVIEGAVISFINIMEMVRVRRELEQARALAVLATVVRDSSDAITMHALEGSILGWNPAAEKMYGWSESEALEMNIKDRIPAPLQKEDVDKLEQLSQAETLEPYATQRLHKNGSVIDVTITSTALTNDKGKLYAVMTTERPKKSIKLVR